MGGVSSNSGETHYSVLERLRNTSLSWEGFYVDSNASLWLLWQAYSDYYSVEIVYACKQQHAHNAKRSRAQWCPAQCPKLEAGHEGSSSERGGRTATETKFGKI